MYTESIRNAALLFLIGWLIAGCNTQPKGYMDQRIGLLEVDGSMRFDADITLNAQEQELNQKLVSLRKQMWETYQAQGFFPPAEPFYYSKEHIEQTTLFKLLRTMPKGGLQHLHSSAAVDFRWLIDAASKAEHCYIYWGNPTGSVVKGKLHFYQPDQVPEGFESTQVVLNDTSNRREMLDLLTLREESAQDTVDVWQHFEDIFARIGGFFEYRPIYKTYLRSALDTLAADGIQHTEIRMIFAGGMYDLDHPAGSGYYTADTTIHVLQELIHEMKQDHPDFTLKFIYTHLRFLSKEVVYTELVNAFKYRKKYPELIKGFDLVANEDDGHSTLYFLDNWEKMDSLSEAYGVDMPLYLHDGESDWASVQNLYDAYLLDSRRIGHGFNLMHFPELIEKMKAANICIEVSPLSNQILGYLQDLRLHPANYMLKHGIQCSINSDDPGIFDYNGLSYDYWSIILAWELDLKAVKKLVMNSLTYSSLSEKEKTIALKSWQKKWDEFVAQGIIMLDHTS